MMYSRLKLSRNLLKEDGVIFISIDDNEVHNLHKICDEIFGEKNFVVCLHVEMSTTQGMKVSSALKGNIVKNAESIIVYSKNSNIFNFNKILYAKKDWDTHYSLYFDKNTGKKCTLLEHLKENNLYKNIRTSDIPEYYKNNNDFRKYIHSIAHKIYRDAMCDVAIVLNRDQESQLSIGGYVEYETSTKSYILKKTKTGIIRQLLPLKLAIGETDDFERDFCIRKIRGNWWNDFYKDMMNINKEGKIKFKNGKKPVRLLKDIIKITANDSDIVMDFFAGSATTAHAVMELNATDGSKRKFIMVQLPEDCDEKSEAFKEGYKNVAEISKERIRRAGVKIKEENPIVAPSLDTGFRVLKVASSNMTNVYYTPDTLKQEQLTFLTDNIKLDRTAEDLLFQVLLDWGVNLTLPITKEVIGQCEVFFVGKNALAACFEGNGKITEDFCKELVKRQPLPLRVVFRDSGFDSDNIKINVEQIFKQKSLDTKTEIEIKTI